MQIHSINIQNFRSIISVEVKLEHLTALIGGNNAGKSTILKAIDYFFAAKPAITNHDFCAYAPGEDIEITLNFKNFTPDEIKEFGDAIIRNHMIVTRVFSRNSDAADIFAVRRMGLPEAEDLRGKTSKSDKLSSYRELRSKYSTLPTASNADAAIENLTNWEKENPDLLSMVKTRGFFGAPNVASGKLKKRTSVHLITAVRDATEDATNPKNSEIIELLSEISKQTIENRQPVRDFLELSREQFAQLTNPDSFPELAEISSNLTNELEKYYSNTNLIANWEVNEELKFSFPKPSISIVHQGIETAISHVGHGLQRAALFSVVQYLASAKHSSDCDDNFNDPVSDIILLIEEPEIYQHPSKQVQIYQALKTLTEKFNTETGIRIQIIFATHSEKFIQLSDFNIGRILRKQNLNDLQQTLVSGINAQDCSKALASTAGKDQIMSDEAFCSKLHIFNRDMCEGFFANKIVLVEGVTDKAVLEAYYKIRGIDIHSEGISILEVQGKNNLDKPYIIFSSLGIPTYMVYDNDRTEKPVTNEEVSKSINANQYLQRLVGHDPAHEWPNCCEKNFTAIDEKLEKYLEKVIGSYYDEIFNELQQNWGLNKKAILKNPTAMASVLTESCAKGCEFVLLESIMDRVNKL